ncbi:MAG: hypothetical protein O3B10_00825 [Actinomycetota bacterium]|nr:hypothetical protein [Actinomycetota bacterium]
MAKQIKNKKPIVQTNKADVKILRYLIAFPVLAFVIKMIVMLNVQAGGWLGADGENYLTGVDGFLNQGFFSSEEKLTYWPAGYPLLIWPFAAISITKFLYMLSIIQSLFFAYSTYFLTKSISKTRLSYLAFTASFVISFNPTLSLGSLTVAYETPVASCLMMALGMTITALNRESETKIGIQIIAYIGLWFGLASFMQPRFILVAAVFIFLCVIYSAGRKYQIKLASVGIIALMLLPALLIFRNSEAVGKVTISTNLGTTMNLGVGDETLGGYNRTGPAIKCEPSTPGEALTDNQAVACVIKWYATNPVKTAKLAFHKSLYFWSPWSGPVAEGTSGRNPWLKISPVQNMQKTPAAVDLIQGYFGKTISYLWLLGQLALLVLGFLFLYKGGGLGKRVALLTATPVVLAWLVTLGTIGDHRFRIPTMGLSLLLQVAGFLTIRQKVTKVL